MWPFSRKKSAPNKPTVAVSSGLKQLAEIGVHIRQKIPVEEVLRSLGAGMESDVDCVSLLCVLGSEIKRADFERVSDDIWHFDAECIEDHGAYVSILDRFVILSKGVLPITNVRDFVDVQEGQAWVEFSLDGKKEHWDLEVSDDWVDPNLYSRLQALAVARGAGKRFFIAGLGQDSLISFGDDVMRKQLSTFSGLEFQWE